MVFPSAPTKPCPSINAIIACATDIEGIAPIPDRITMAMELEFDRNSAAVRPQYREELRKLANFMKANPKVTATVEGHTGNLQTTKALAMEISQRRAQDVVNYLVTEFTVVMDLSMLLIRIPVGSIATSLALTSASSCSAPRTRGQETCGDGS